MGGIILNEVDRVETVVGDHEGTLVVVLGVGEGKNVDSAWDAACNLLDLLVPGHDYAAFVVDIAAASVRPANLELR